MPILFSEFVFVSANMAELLFQFQDLIFEGLDIQFLSLSVGSTTRQLYVGRSGSMYVPLGLAIELLSSCEGWLAVGLWTSSLRWLAINCAASAADLNKVELTYP